MIVEYQAMVLDVTIHNLSEIISASLPQLKFKLCHSVDCPNKLHDTLRRTVYKEQNNEPTAYISPQRNLLALEASRLSTKPGTSKVHGRILCPTVRETWTGGQ